MSQKSKCFCPGAFGSRAYAHIREPPAKIGAVPPHIENWTRKVGSVFRVSRRLHKAEENHRNHTRLALMEEFKTLPFSAVWDKLCLDVGVPVGIEWLEQVDQYEKTVLLKRK